MNKQSRDRKYDSSKANMPNNFMEIHIHLNNTQKNQLIFLSVKSINEII